MNLLSGEQSENIERFVSEFCKKEILPYNKTWDENQCMPNDIYKKFGKAGFLGIVLQKNYGGRNKKFIEYIKIIEEIAKYDPTIALAISSQNSLSISHISIFGSEEQKNYWLPKICSGDIISSWALTEEEAGSDAAGIKTYAKKVNDKWVINGKKIFITNGKSCDIVILIAKTIKGYTTFLIEKNTKGFHVGKQENKLGMRALDTTELIFQDCVVSSDNMIGEEGLGFKQAMKVLEGGRLSLAALGLGISRGALDLAVEYAKNRVQFGNALVNFQGISFKIAELVSQIKSAQLLTYYAANKQNYEHNVNSLASMAKLVTSELAVKTADTALQIFGKYGYSKEYRIEKFYRDAKLCTIGEGTSEIQKIIISKDCIKKGVSKFLQI